MKKTLIYSGAILLSAGIIAFSITNKLEEDRIAIQKVLIENQNQKAIATNNVGNSVSQTPLSFEVAANKSLNSVVHVKTSSKKSGGYSYNSLGDLFFGSPSQKLPDKIMSGSGSGVVISGDGYIATNHHVIAGADEIKITFNDKKTLSATVIGQDPNTDLALLKVDGQNFEAIEYGNSDQVKVGEWVLAVGNPYNLTSTVTAGIVSAKGRDINILKEQYAIESFIQTDAAVNPGNSGGALVNSTGELVGINAAISSNTGSYTGYSFAIPVNIVKKVMNDLRKYGAVQRGLLGVQIQNISEKVAKDNSLNSLNGVYINKVFQNSAATEAGLKQGDIIVEVQNKATNSANDLQESLSQFGPGDKIDVKFLRGGVKKSTSVQLKNQHGNYTATNKAKRVLGASFKTISEKQKNDLSLSNGVQIDKLENGKLSSEGLREGFIITHIDNERVLSEEDVISKLEQKKGGVLIEGVYPNGKKSYFGFGM